MQYRLTSDRLQLCKCIKQCNAVHFMYIVCDITESHISICICTSECTRARGILILGRSALLELAMEQLTQELLSLPVAGAIYGQGQPTRPFDGEPKVNIEPFPIKRRTIFT